MSAQDRIGKCSAKYSSWLRKVAQKRDGAQGDSCHFLLLTSCCSAAALAPGYPSLFLNWKHPRQTIHSSWDVCRPWNTETDTTTTLLPPSWIERAQDRFRPPQGPTGYHHSVHGHDREPWQDGCYMLPPVSQ